MTQHSMHYQIKRIIAMSAAVIISLTILAGGTKPIMTETTATAESSAMTANKNKISDAQDSIDALKKKEAELDKKINDTSGDIDKEAENQKAIDAQITTVQKTLTQLDKSITELGKKIDSLQVSIADDEKNVATKKTEIENGIGDFKQRLRAMYISGDDRYTNIIIGSTDFYDMLMKIELVKRVAKHDNGMIDNLIALKTSYENDAAKLKKNKATLESSKKSFESQKADSTEQKAKLQKLYTQSKTIQAQLEKDKAAYEKNKKAANSEQNEFEENLQKLYKEQQTIKKKEEAEAARKKAAAEAAKKAAEAAKKAAEEAAKNQNSGGSSSSGTTTTKPSSSTNNSDYGYTTKSQFTWPVPGHYGISYGIGWRWGAYHNGIDIYDSSIRGANICAAAAGTVIQVNNSCTHDYGKNYSCGCGGGYGNYCVIDHGNGYWTLYGHSEHMNVTLGQHVTQGQVLGTVGSTGYSTGPHLHFEVRLNGQVMNPQNYV